MKMLLLKLLISFGFQLLREHIADDSDTSDIEEELIAAKSKEAVVAVAKKEAIRVIDESVLTDVEIPNDIVESLATANSTEEVVEVLESEAGQRTLFDVLGAVIAGVGGLIGSLFGKKNNERNVGVGKG